MLLIIILAAHAFAYPAKISSVKYQQEWVSKNLEDRIMVAGASCTELEIYVNKTEDVDHRSNGIYLYSISFSNPPVRIAHIRPGEIYVHLFSSVGDYFWVSDSVDAATGVFSIQSLSSYLCGMNKK